MSGSFNSGPKLRHLDIEKKQLNLKGTGTLLEDILSHEQDSLKVVLFSGYFFGVDTL